MFSQHLIPEILMDMQFSEQICNDVITMTSLLTPPLTNPGPCHWPAPIKKLARALHKFLEMREYAQIFDKFCSNCVTSSDVRFASDVTCFNKTYSMADKRSIAT